LKPVRDAIDGGSVSIHRSVWLQRPTQHSAALRASFLVVSGRPNRIMAPSP
jgi:hypothetical protein